jgi:hypothetical protein
MAGIGPIVANCFKSGLLDIHSYRAISSTTRDIMFPNGAGTTVKMVPTDYGGQILAINGEFMEGFQHRGGDIRAASGH